MLYRGLLHNHPVFLLDVADQVVVYGVLLPAVFVRARPRWSTDVDSCVLLQVSTLVEVLRAKLAFVRSGMLLPVLPAAR